MTLDRCLLLLILTFQALQFAGLAYVCDQIDRSILAPATHVASAVRDTTTILTQGPIRGAMYMAQHPKAAALWSSASEYVAAAAKKTARL